MTDITVVGSGVSGLSAARNLQLAGFDVHIITRELPQFTTSVAAGAIWYGYGCTGSRRDWAQRSLDHFLALSKKENSGVSLQRVREVFAYPAEAPWYKDQLPFFKRTAQWNLPDDAQDGWSLDLPIVEAPLYLQNLYDEFLQAGGTIETREINSIDELVASGKLIVNCTGVWAKQVVKDASVYPIRGQTLLLDAPQISVGFMRNATYLFPRGDGVLIGGNYHYNNWNLELDPDQAADIIERCSQVEPSVADSAVIRQFVGLRPGREEVRLELEKLSSDCSVIHNYGHGAIGFTLSWGCANAVTELAQNLLGR